MTPPPTSIDGTDITGATIDGQDVQEITVDGQTVFQAGPPIVDNFEQSLYGDQGQTLVDYYDGGKAGSSDPNLNFVNRTSSAAQKGSFGLNMVAGAGTGATIVSLPSDGLPNYPVAGDTFQTVIRSPSAGTTKLSAGYGLQNVGVSKPGFGGSEGYFVRLDFQTQNIEFLVNENGGSNTAKSQGVALSTNEFYRVSIDWGVGGLHTLELFDSTDTSLATITHTDSTYTSGGIGFGMNDGFGRNETGHFDQYTLQ